MAKLKLERAWIADDAHLSPSQASAFGRLKEAIEVASLVVFEGAAGTGKSRIVERLLEELGGECITMRDFLTACAGSAHVAMEAPFLRVLEDSFKRSKLVVFEDFDLVGETLGGYLRGPLFAAGLMSFMTRVRAEAKCLVLTGASFAYEATPEKFKHGYLMYEMAHLKVEPFGIADWAFFLEKGLGSKVAHSLDAVRLFQHAPGLNGHQLSRLCRLLAMRETINEPLVRTMIDTRILRANMDLGEVATIQFSDLKGFGDLVEALTTYVITPLLADARFDAIGLTPKRGVLLYGPPGTGKTSVGRALARQMEGKFFKIDGSIPTEPAKDFYPRIDAIFRAAKRAAPCVVFIDDADVLFQSDRSTGLGRYLLSLLDGLESESSGKVAVILTAMNPNLLPPALLRSGRVELWLETCLPSAEVRADIISADLKRVAPLFDGFEFAPIAEITEGFNAADMRRIVTDVKALYARDIVEERAERKANDYFEQAARDVRRNKDLLSLAENRKLVLGGAPTTLA
jgi:transitional endoplasmic reticulum ATPase